MLKQGPDFHLEIRGNRDNRIRDNESRLYLYLQKLDYYYYYYYYCYYLNFQTGNGFVVLLTSLAEKDAMMRTTARRLRVLGKHFLQSSVTPNLSPNLAVSPRTSLIDETVRISLSGLEPNQIVRLVAQVVENNVKFESQGVFRASSDGVVDLDSAASLAGSYTGKYGRTSMARTPLGP